MEANEFNRPLVSVRNLKKNYQQPSASLFHKKNVLSAIKDVSFDIQEGETLGLVGESGSGKSTIGKIIVGLEKPTAGTVSYSGKDLNQLSRMETRQIRTDFQMIFQDPYSSLNPRKRVYDILAAPLLFHKIVSKEGLNPEVDRLLQLVGLSAAMKDRYPHEFSGGQRQRIGIARAISLNPKFLVCDEPVSALDVSVQAQILNLLRNLQKKLKISMLFIGHDLGAVSYVSDRIAVICSGEIVEMAQSKELFSHPLHAYTKMLKASIPIPDPNIRNLADFHYPEKIFSDLEKQGELVLVDKSTSHYVQS